MSAPILPSSSDPSVDVPVQDALIQNTPPMRAQEDMSDSPFAKMFPGGLTKEQFQKVLDGYLKMIVHDMKRADEKWKKSQERLRKASEGKPFFD